MSQERLLRSVQRLSCVLSRLERQTAAQQGVSVSQMRVLIYLGQAEDQTGVRLSDLADDQGLALSTMTRNVSLLEQNGWVRREAGREDRRVVTVALTEPGRRLAASLRENSVARFSSAFRTFHPSDRIERAVAMDRVAEALERIEGPLKTNEGEE
jgi:DNA-binding MarR family transcriptional regulator